MRPFGGLNPEQIETFVERVELQGEFVDALDRWRAMRGEGWDVTALTVEDGGQLIALVGLGWRYALERMIA